MTDPVLALTVGMLLGCRARAAQGRGVQQGRQRVCARSRRWRVASAGGWAGLQPRLLRLDSLPLPRSFTAIVRTGRERIHSVVRETLSERELHDGLLFAACALIVLPLLPDRGFGPHGSLNPSIIWRLVVIVMAVQAAGYVAPRAIGPRYGLLVAGLLGGFVSSTATIGIMGSRAVREPHARRGERSAYRLCTWTARICGRPAGG